MQLQSLTVEFIILQISVAFSPGLIIALVVNEAVQKGRKNALQVAYGAATGAIGITIITAAVITANQKKNENFNIATNMIIEI